MGGEAAASSPLSPAGGVIRPAAAAGESQSCVLQQQKPGLNPTCVYQCTVTSAGKTLPPVLRTFSVLDLIDDVGGAVQVGVKDPATGKLVCKKQIDTGQPPQKCVPPKVLRNGACVEADSVHLGRQWADLKDSRTKRDRQFAAIAAVNKNLQAMGRTEPITYKTPMAEIELAIQVLAGEIKRRDDACKEKKASAADCQNWRKAKPAMAALLARLLELKSLSGAIAGLQAGIRARKPATPAPTFKPAGLRMGEWGKDLIRYHEKLVLVPTPDPANPNQMNIGYGHPLTPAERKKYAKGITKAQAEALLVQDIANKERDLRTAINPDLKLTQNQWDALVSLYYNLIPGAFAKSRVRAHLNTGNYAGAIAEWTTLGRGTKMTDPKTGKAILDPKTGDPLINVLPGLQRRRLDEIDLWNTP